ncbi:hypothetical protein V8C35DRAFT_199589 [Trichoderma chlorosporum]
MGIGVSLCFAVISTVPSQCFSTKRGLANGFMFASSGFGGAAIKLCIRLLDPKTWYWMGISHPRSQDAFNGSSSCLANEGENPGWETKIYRMVS